jgi:Tol biopolymer transport system component
MSIRSPVWAPDGKHLLLCVWFPADWELTDWYVIPLDGGPAVRTGAREVFRRTGLAAAAGFPGRIDPDVWLAERNEVVFSAKSGDSANLWKVSISPTTWKVVGQPQRLTSGTGLELYSSASDRGLLALSSLTRNHDIWSLPVDADRAKVTGGIERLTSDSADDISPSISADGKKLSFESLRTGKRLVWTKDLETGREVMHPDEVPPEALPKIAPDGSSVAYSMFTFRTAGAAPDIYVAPFMGGQGKRVCEKCGYVWGWSPDSTKFLYGFGRSISLLDLAGSRQYKVLEVPGNQVWSGRFSWDQQWISFNAGVPRETPRPFVVRFRDGEQLRESDWIRMAGGGHQPWSPNGTLVYFASPLDGLLCIWSSRLNPETKQPLGPPQPVYHFHRAKLSLPSDPDWLGISVARDKIVFALRELTGNIWIAKPRP